MNNQDQSSKTVLGLLRHGQTDWNVQGLLQGVSDIALNEYGVLQAHAAAQEISRDSWDLIITSPLSRAKETARIIAEKNGFDQPKIEPLLMERAFGEAEGRSYLDWKQALDSHRHIEGSESLAELESRVLAMLEMVEHQYAGLRVLAVSHGALIRKVVRVASNRELPREGERLLNTSLNIFERDQSGWKISVYQTEPLGLV